jgi:hypothetical protein
VSLSASILRPRCAHITCTWRTAAGWTSEGHLWQSDCMWPAHRRRDALLAQDAEMEMAKRRKVGFTWLTTSILLEIFCCVKHAAPGSLAPRLHQLLRLGHCGAPVSCMLSAGMHADGRDIGGKDCQCSSEADPVLCYVNIDAESCNACIDGRKRA